MGKKKAKRAVARWSRRLREEPRFRDFRQLGWTVFLVPMDLASDVAEIAPEAAGGFTRTVARMLIGTRYGFTPDQLCDLRTRRLQVDDEPERVWWVMAARTTDVDRLRRKRPPAS